MRDAVRWPIALAVAIALPLMAASAEETPGACLILGRWTESKLSSRGHAGQVLRTREASFNLGTVGYRVKYNIAANPAHPDQVEPVEGYIGMPAPSAENWYHSGFLFIAVNGHDLGTVPLSSMVASEQGRRGMVDMVWHHPVASVRARFAGLCGDDKLMVEIAVEPRQDIRSITVQARCYPSFFTAWHHRKGARRVKTPSKLIQEGQTVALEPSANWWLLYYDEVFDVAKGEGVGPCAMAFLPDEAEAVKVRVGDYAVDTTIRYGSSVRRIRLAFWDMKGSTNADALASFPQKSQKAREQLAKMDFTPQLIHSFDLSERRRELQELLRTPDIPDKLQTALREQISALERAEAARKSHAEPTITVEEDLLKSMDAFESVYWEVKLRQLLDF